MQSAVLLVDPDDRARGALAEYLWTSGLPVLEAKNGSAAMHLAREWRIGVAIIDPWPGVSDALGIVERLRGDGPAAPVPIVVLSSTLSPSWRQRLLSAGCATCLEKPCAPEAVLVEVRRLASADSSGDGVAPARARSD